MEASKEEEGEGGEGKVMEKHKIKKGKEKKQNTKLMQSFNKMEGIIK